MIASYIALQLGVDIREATRLLIAWNVGAWAFLVLILHMAMDPSARCARPVAARGREPMGAGGHRHRRGGRRPGGDRLGARPGQGHDAAGRKAGHLALVGATILSAWTFLHVMFALHYAGVYFEPKKGGIRAGLEFPGTPQPGWGEFFYQAFVIGCTFATSDVNVTSMRMRRICVIQGVVGFFFNTIILALTINVAADLF